MNSLFGVELPTPVNFLIAFVVVLVLIGAAAWLVRRLGATRLEAAARGRQPRLAVIDSAAVDSRRRLVIIRRDNVEHLLMIGGPSDVVVETNIIRAAPAASREVATAARTNGNGEHAPRPLPLPDPDVWPQLPEPASTSVQPAPIMRGPRPTADEVQQWQSSRSTSTLSAASTSTEPAAAAPSLRAPRQPDTLAGLATDLASGGRTEAIPAPPPAPPAPPLPPIAPSADQSLAEMAQRLEAALRRPAPAKMAMDSGSRSAGRSSDPIVAPSVAPKSTPQPKPPITAPTSLEKEMANLLGRPGKT